MLVNALMFCGQFAFLRKPLVESVFVGLIQEAIAAQTTQIKEP